MILRHAAGRSILRSILLLCGVCSLLLACRGTSRPRPSPTPAPTVRPSPTAVTHPRVLDGSRFAITLGGELLATEEIRVEEVGGQLLVTSELRRNLDYPAVEKRILTLADSAPWRYELEVNALGARSLWIAQRQDGTVDLLSNNLDWFGPVLLEGLEPAPDLLLESVPSALPFALLALRFEFQGAQGEASPPLALRALDVLEDFPVSRPLTLTAAPARQGMVIGTVALEGEIASSRNPRFTMWVRPSSRTLYSVEIPSYRFNLWWVLAHPGLGRLAPVVIQRVSTLPELSAPPARGQAKRLALEFNGADGTLRRGTLILPEGAGPFPCLVLHSAGGVAPRWDPGDAPTKQGWAVFCYDKAGLGESQGTFNRGSLRALAQDALAAAAMLRQRPEIDPRRLVFLGTGEGGQVGALAMMTEGGYSAAVLGSCAAAGPVIPTLAQYRIRSVLATFHGWQAARTLDYEKSSLGRWQEWLAAGQNEVALLRRRIAVGSLQDLAQTDLAVVLAQAKGPVLLLQGQYDGWTPVERARDLASRLKDAGVTQVTLQIVPDLGADLGSNQNQGWLGPQAEQILWTWLERTLPR